MSTNNTPVVSARGNSRLVRPRFAPGMLLEHEDLDQMLFYTRDLSRLLFSSLFGCGVVCGLVVSVQERCGKVYVDVQRGLALDCEGDPIHVPQKTSLVINDDCRSDIVGPLWVALCGTRKQCAPRTSVCGCDDEETSHVHARERDGYEIRIVREKPECICRCPEYDPNDPSQELLDSDCKCANPELECHRDHYAGNCGCDCEDCSKCDCDCVLLARLNSVVRGDETVWTVDHRVRRFIRPVLMRDPQVEIEASERQQAEQESAAKSAAFKAPEPKPAEPKAADPKPPKPAKK